MKAQSPNHWTAREFPEPLKQIETKFLKQSETEPTYLMALLPRLVTVTKGASVLFISVSLYTQQTIFPGPRGGEKSYLEETSFYFSGQTQLENSFCPQRHACPHCSPTHLGSLTLPMPISLSQMSGHLFLKKQTPLWYSSHHQQLEDKLCLYKTVCSAGQPGKLGFQKDERVPGGFCGVLESASGQITHCDKFFPNCDNSIMPSTKD